MAVKTVDEILNAIRLLWPDDTRDEVLALYEDITDTYNSYTDGAKNDEWKKKYDELDKMWREKYRDRFFETKIDDEVTVVDDGMGDEKYMSYDDLFTTKEEE